MELFTEGELAEVVCICAEEGWSSGDLLGDNFFPMQNRHKLKLHFENKYRLNLNDFRDGSQQFIVFLSDVFLIFFSLSGSPDGQLLLPKATLPTTKCGIQSCSIQHNNDACVLCARAGLTRRYCGYHDQHNPNRLGIDHFTDISSSMTVHELCMESSVLSKQLAILRDDEIYHHQRLKVVVEACKANNWKSGDLLGDEFDAYHRRDSLCVDMAVDEKLMELVAARESRLEKKYRKLGIDHKLPKDGHKLLLIRAIQEVTQEKNSGEFVCVVCITHV